MSIQGNLVHKLDTADEAGMMAVAVDFMLMEGLKVAEVQFASLAELSLVPRWRRHGCADESEIV